MQSNKGNRELAEVLQYQEKIDLVDKAIGTLEISIAAQGEVLAGLELPGEDPALKELRVQRENQLAELAIGQGSKSELERLTELYEIAVGKSSAEAESLGLRYSEVSQTISGLRRKLEEAEKNCCDFERERYYAVQLYLKAEAELVGAAYAQAAMQLASLHRRLLALDRILIGYQPAASIETPQKKRLTIPLFNLDSLRGMVSADCPGESWAAARTILEDNCLPTAIKAERERIVADGVALK